MENKKIFPNNKKEINNKHNEYKIEILSEDDEQLKNPEQEILDFKLIVIGDSFVGKSSLILQATTKKFNYEYNATIGFDFLQFICKINNVILKMQIWDTCGQEIYRSLIHSFYNNSSLSILVYSIIDKNSFNNLDGWLKEIKTFTSPTQPIFLIGNKSDLENERKVNQNDVDIFMKNNKIDFFIETSAKDNKNISNVFIQAAKVLYKKYKDYNNIKLENTINVNVEKIDKKINLKEEKIKKTKKKCC